MLSGFEGQFACRVWLMAALLTGCLLVSAPRALASTQVQVPATSGPSSSAGTTPFVDGGPVDGSASISGSGTLDVTSPGASYGNNITPDGDPTAGACPSACPAPTFTYWTLIARIGTGPWQVVGTGPTTIYGTGELYLGVDDDGYTDNSGWWMATIDTPAQGTDDSRLGIAEDVQNGTVTSNSGSIDCGSSCLTSYPPGTPVTLTATPASGYQFTGWVGGGCLGSGPCQVASASTTNVEATFGPAPSGSQPVLTLASADDQNGGEPRGATMTYTLTAGVSPDSPASESSPRLITIYDPLPAGETLAGAPSGTGWNCDESGGTEVRCSSNQTSVPAGTTLPPVTIPVAVSSAAPSPLSNVAELISSDAQSVILTTDTVTAPVTVSPPAPTVPIPVNTDRPGLTNRPLPGNSLLCSTGSWTGKPTSYAYGWTRDGAAIAGASGNRYTVRVSDEAHTLACRVTARNAAGESQPATSPGRLVAIDGTLACPKPSGTVKGADLGPLSIGMTKAEARHKLRRYSSSGRFDDFCLYAGWGVRVGYAPSNLLKSVEPARRSELTGRIVVALTANPFYHLDGIAPGQPLSSLAKHRTLGKPLAFGANRWYFLTAAHDTWVFKVRAGTVQEIGLANKLLTTGHAAQTRFLRSFNAG